MFIYECTEYKICCLSKSALNIIYMLVSIFSVVIYLHLNTSPSSTIFRTWACKALFLIHSPSLDFSTNSLPLICEISVRSDRGAILSGSKVILMFDETNVETFLLFLGDSLSRSAPTRTTLPTQSCSVGSERRKNES